MLLAFFLLFFSGAAALVYEVVWGKVFSVLLGNTTLAHTIVLSTFMFGMAAGYALFGEVSRRVKNSLALFGWMEMGIGLYAALFFYLLPLAEGFYLAAARAAEGPVVTAAKFFACALALFPPTFLMGGTLPAAVHAFARLGEKPRAAVGRLYAANTFGAVFGILLSALYLIPDLGLEAAMMTGAILDTAVGLASWLWSKSLLPPLCQKREEPSQPAGRPAPLGGFTAQQKLVVAAAALSGAGALIYEIGWIRLLALVLGASTYAFSLMLAAFITGLALGGTAAERLNKIKSPARAFAFCEATAAFIVLLSLFIYPALPFLFYRVSGLLVRSPQTYPIYLGVQFFVCFGLMAPVAFFLGLALPLASEAVTDRLGLLSRRMGGVFAFNTLGAVAGATVGGMVLLPLLGIQQTLIVGSLVHLASFLLVFLSLPGGRGARLAFAAAFFCAALLLVFATSQWDKRLLSAGLFRARGNIPLSFKDYRRRLQGVELLYYKDDPNTTVTVEKRGEEMSLKVSGKVDASSGGGDLPTQIATGHIPLLLHPAPKRVLVVGLGSGMTAAAALTHEGVTVDVVEISPAVVEAARLFAEHNHRVLDNPRLKIIVDDARTYIKTTTERYDVVISEPSNPWMSGVGSLFTAEFYADLLKVLSPGAVVLQWMQAYELDDFSFKMIARTFSQAFPHASLWNTSVLDTAFVGSREPIRPDFRKMRERMRAEAVKEDLARIDADDPLQLLSMQAVSEGLFRLYVEGEGITNSDRYPLLEYRAPRALYTGQAVEAIQKLDQRLGPLKGSELLLESFLAGNPLAADQIYAIGKRLARWPPFERSMGFRLIELSRQAKPDDLALLASFRAQLPDTKAAAALFKKQWEKEKSEQTLRQYVTFRAARELEDRPFGLGDVEELQAWVQKALKEDPQRKWLYRFYLGKCAFYLGDFPTALAHLQVVAEAAKEEPLEGVPPTDLALLLSEVERRVGKEASPKKATGS